MEYKATSKHMHVSTRKMRLIADAVRKLSVQEALVQLDHMSKAGAKLLARIIASAVANAGQKQVKADALKITRIEVMGGSSMKRWHAASKGQAHPYKKRMTHITVILSDEHSEGNSADVKEVQK